METGITPDDGYQRSIVNYMLLPSENIIHVSTISRGAYWKGFVSMVIALVFFVKYGFWLGFYAFAIGGVLLVLAYWNKNYLVLAATDHRVIIRAGIFNQHVLQLRYPQIESVDTFYTLAGIFMGYGSVTITGTGTSRWIVPFVQDATVFRDLLTQKLLEREEPLAYQAAPFIPTIPPPASSQPQAPG